MADNTQLNANVTSGDIVATDDIGGIKHQRVKVEYGDDGSATDVSHANPMPAVLRDPEMGTVPEISHFGALKTSSSHRVLGGNFSGGSLDTALWTDGSSGSGTATVADGVLIVDSGGTSGGIGLVNSVQSGLFISGQVTVFQTGVVLDVESVANNTRRWGVFDANNGCFFEVENGNFSVVTRKNTTDTKVASGSFSQAPGTTPGTDNITYRIFYSAGKVIFKMGGTVVHIHQTTSSDFIWTANLNLPIRYESENTGASSGGEIIVRGSSVSIFGNLDTVRIDEDLNTDRVVEIVRAVATGPDYLTGTFRNIVTSDEGEQFVTSTPQERGYCVFFKQTSQTASEHFILIDIDDSTNYFHDRNGRIDVTVLTVQIKSNAGTSEGSLRLGVVARQDGTDGDVYWATELMFRTSASDRVQVDSLNFNPDQIKFGVASNKPNKLTTSLSTLNHSDFSNVASLTTPVGSATPAVGDVVVEIDIIAGNIDWNIKAHYHGET